MLCALKEAQYGMKTLFFFAPPKRLGEGAAGGGRKVITTTNTKGQWVMTHCPFVIGLTS